MLTRGHWNLWGYDCFVQFWTESFVQWSPLGTYLATIHRQGAAVWGGEKSFNRLMRYIHPQVKLVVHFQINLCTRIYIFESSTINVMTLDFRVLHEIQGSLKSSRGISLPQRWMYTEVD